MEIKEVVNTILTTSPTSENAMSIFFTIAILIGSALFLDPNSALYKKAVVIPIWAWALFVWIFFVLLIRAIKVAYGRAADKAEAAKGRKKIAAEKEVDFDRRKKALLSLQELQQRYLQAELSDFSVFKEWASSAAVILAYDSTIQETFVQNSNMAQLFWDSLGPMAFIMCMQSAVTTAIKSLEAEICSEKSMS